MAASNDGNNDIDSLPFAGSEIATEIEVDQFRPQHSKYGHKRLRHRSKGNQSSVRPSDETNQISYAPSSIYFEHCQDENSTVSLVPYTGPSNTSHLSKRLYVPQLTSPRDTESPINLQNFIQDYDRRINILTSASASRSLCIFLRFGISYVVHCDESLSRLMSLKDYTHLRKEGKRLKTSFYTCKGVTSPKGLLASLIKENYQQTSSNTYSYDIQLYRRKGKSNSILHFHYDEHFQCRSVFRRPDSPANLDFIRDKSSSRFRSIDDSYADMFDFRIQVVPAVHLSTTDPLVLEVLQGVPIDQVLLVDRSSHVLHIAPKLHRYVKYLKCTHSSRYHNFDHQLLISMGTYEEFHLNDRGVCEPVMKAENTMTIEYLDRTTVPDGKQLYNLGMWFSTLCQTCVDASASIPKKSDLTESSRWFSGLSAFAEKYDRSVRKVHVTQLTTYKTAENTKSYNNEDLTFVKKILQEEDLRRVLLDSRGGQLRDRKRADEVFDDIQQRLRSTGVPSAQKALSKVERAYALVCEDLAQTSLGNSPIGIK